MSKQISDASRPTATVIEDTDFFVLDRGENGVTYRVPGSLINAPYRVWAGIVSQVGTDDPTAIVLQNNLLGAITFAYNALNGFDIESVGLFTPNKTLVIYLFGSPSYINSNLVQVNSTGFINRFLEIRIYK